MNKIVLSAALLVAFTLSSAFAGNCPGGGCGGGDKEKDGKKSGQTNAPSFQPS